MFDREPFLKAVFADPADDLPRLVFADYLDEQGDAEWADLIRVQCELSRRKVGREGADDDSGDKLFDREAELFGSERLTWMWNDGRLPPERGFPLGTVIRVPAHLAADGEAFRRTALASHPEWYGATALKIIEGRLTRSTDLVTLLTSPVTERVSDIDLSGQPQEAPLALCELGDGIGLSVLDFEIRPVVTVRVVEALAQMREARRLTSLDLTDNDLDNDAARAIASSPHLFRLRRLAFARGNRFRGRTWQQLVERFGTDVLS